jgi:alpha-L-fucosidase
MGINWNHYYPMRLLTALATFSIALSAQTNNAPTMAGNGNKPERMEWFRDIGFGLFIHWSVDSQLGSVISHSLAGASKDYRDRYFSELPKTFNPRKYNPTDWAALAKLAGIKYVVFTTKHHNGFTMYPSKTTEFGLQSTPFKRDINGELVAAFREQGIAPGYYFSPDDFLHLHKRGLKIQRNIPEVAPAAVPGLMDLDKAQLRELLGNYGPIDVIFFDGPAEGLRELAWEMQPNIVVTRGAIATPEQYVPGSRIEGPWESCITMGTQWQYKPTNDVYKSGTELIGLLIETRAKGGNLLLNVGPKPDGELPIEQEERLREIALWMFVNQEMVYGVRPWIVPSEKNGNETYWFTKKKDAAVVYVAVRPNERWKYGEWKDILLRSVKLAAGGKVEVLGQNDEVLEYQPKVVPKTTWTQGTDGLRVRAMRAQRLYNDRKWPNPVVLKITGAQAAFAAPEVSEAKWRWDGVKKVAVLEAELKNMSNQTALEVGFEYRSVKGLDLTERAGNFTRTALVRRTGTGRFTAEVPWKSGDVMEFRAVVRHPLLEAFSIEQRADVK